MNKFLLSILLLLGSCDLLNGMAGRTCLEVYSLNHQYEDGSTELMRQVQEQDLDLIECFLKRKANPWIEDNRGENAFHAAARTGNIEIMRLLAKYCSSDPRWMNMLERHNAEVNKESPLDIALDNNYRGIAFILKNAHKYRTLLNRALLLADYSNIQFIIKFKDQIEGQSVLDIQLTSRCVEECNDPCDHPRHNGLTPLSFAIMLEDQKLVHYLLEQGARKVGPYLTRTMISMISQEIHILLHLYNISFEPIPSPIDRLAPRDPQFCLAQALLVKDEAKLHKALADGATINMLDAKGNTALHWLCTEGNPDAIAKALSLGADPNAQDRVKKRTGLHWLLRMHKKSVEKSGRQLATSELLPCMFLLMCHGANAHIKDGSGRSIGQWITAKDKNDKQRFTKNDIKLLQRILKAGDLNMRERKDLLSEIYTYQRLEGRKFREYSMPDKFNLQDVYNVDSVKVMTAYNGQVQFKDIYLPYIT